MDALLIAEFQKANPFSFIAVRLDLPTQTLCLTSGGIVTFTCTDHDGGTEEKTFVPFDDDYGFLSYVGEIEEGADDTTAAPDLGFEVFSEAAVATFTAAAAQGSPWTLYWGAVDPSTGDVVGAPVEWFSGRLNVGSVEFDQNRRGLQFSNYTEEQFQLLADGACRLSDSFHQQCWPGELGMSHVTGLTRKIWWRLTSPRGSVTSGGIAGGQGGTNTLPGLRRERV